MILMLITLMDKKAFPDFLARKLWCVYHQNSNNDNDNKIFEIQVDSNY